MNRFFGLSLIIFVACTGQNKSGQDVPANSLINESSPYLLQHAYNPVNWYPWGEEALEKAKEDDKLMIISIGYAACHWCHVMEKESFEDSSVAAKMNSHFVSVKIDREERPDIDKIYMDAAILVNGSGGWPLNVIALPDSRPVFAGTYYPKEDWLKTLDYFQNIFETKRERLEKQAELITNGINTIEQVPPGEETGMLTDAELVQVLQTIHESVDFEYGGKKGAPKFPVPSLFEYLLAYGHITKDEQSIEAVTISLDRMINGGIYDPIDGGFSRYSTDSKWQVPHFEKMIYDNAQLISLLSHAYAATGDMRYQDKMEQTIAFVEKELTAPEGIFYSSLNADSEGEEGKYYTWNADSLEDVLVENYPVFKDFYGITRQGNWEDGRNILFKNEKVIDWKNKYGLNKAEVDSIIRACLNRLQVVRDQREKPSLDDKSITAWNGLMVSGLVDAYKSTENQIYLERALKAAEFLRSTIMGDDGSLQRNYKNGVVSINGFLDDYAFLIRSFLDVYQATFDERWLFDAKKMVDYTLENFMEDSTGFFFYTSAKDAPLIARKKELNDAVIPSSNAVMAKNLFILGTILYAETYLEQAKRMMENIRPNLMESPVYFNHWAHVQLFYTFPFYEVAIVGPGYREKLREISTEFLPNAILIGGASEGKLELLQNKLVDGKTMIYVCREKACKRPTDQVGKALELVR
jgi:hypothetical protein